MDTTPAQTLARALRTDPALLDAQWKNVQAWLARRFEQETVSMESILFLIGVQEAGKGYSPRLDKEVKQDRIMTGTYHAFEKVGLYVRDEKAPEGWRRSADLPGLSLDEQEKLLRVAIVRYFAEYVEDLPAAEWARREPDEA